MNSTQEEILNEAAKEYWYTLKTIRYRDLANFAKSHAAKQYWQKQSEVGEMKEKEERDERH